MHILCKIENYVELVTLLENFRYNRDKGLIQRSDGNAGVYIEGMSMVIYS